jgi:hypothetical protein
MADSMSLEGPRKRPFVRMVSERRPHTTSSETADLIVQDGFRDGRDHYMTKLEHSGVWLSDEPLDEQDGGATGDAIVVEITEEVVRPYEWVETSSTSTLGR